MRAAAPGRRHVAHHLERRVEIPVGQDRDEDVADPAAMDARRRVAGYLL
jgi:hypothetical protein